jgi:hypothetical protein
MAGILGVKVLMTCLRRAINEFPEDIEAFLVGRRHETSWCFFWWGWWVVFWGGESKC